MLEPDTDSGYIYWTLTLFQLKKFQLKVSPQYVCYIIWESHCTKIMVARLLKLIVLYIRIDESVWHPNTEPTFFRTRFVKRLKTAEKFWKVHFSGDVVTLNSSSTQQIYVPLVPKIRWVQNWLKFISGNYNVFEAMSSFIKKLRYVVR